jgi:hypothetical protein
MGPNMVFQVVRGMRPRRTELRGSENDGQGVARELDKKNSALSIPGEVG